MKNPFNLFPIVALAAVTSMMACSTPEEKVTDAQADVETASADLAKANAQFVLEHDQFNKDAQRMIEENEKAIAQLKNETRAFKEEAKIQFEKNLAELEARNENLKSKIKDHNKDDSEKWEQFKREFNHDMTELGTALNDLFKDNKK
jgi:septal ring factor EnvC (AmiA/AmiB activator)